jgi:hypothetical protein
MKTVADGALPVMMLSARMPIDALTEALGATGLYNTH